MELIALIINNNDYTNYLLLFNEYMNPILTLTKQSRRPAFFHILQIKRKSQRKINIYPLVTTFRIQQQHQQLR